MVFSLLILGLSFLYAAIVLNPNSTYVDGLLPTLIGRGIGIPIFFSCATFVIMRALPLGKSGLASGTLGMARNIGTAFGIAALGQVFTGQINSAIAQQQHVFLSAAQQNSSRAAAEQFVASGHGMVHIVMVKIILQGFMAQSLLCVLFFAVTLVLTLFIRKRRVAANPSVSLPSQARQSAAPSTL
jgi:MFS transporter, DHA2 family, methylenomycin A resistance protein